MTLLKELINIPERVHRDDFVLKLVEDVGKPDVVLNEYVVTDELVNCFDAALSFIQNAVANRSSKATYLHGSFGSGKSHFMAVLHLILQGNARARGIPELAAVIQKHNAWMEGKRFLLIPYHMLGAHDMESGVLGNYVTFMRQLHADAPIPPVYMSATIIDAANNERSNYGDEAFFQRLNTGLDDGWGDLDCAWDGNSFDEAAAAPPDAENHLRLVSALLKTVAASHADVISSRGGTFVRFDAGLSIISRHAADLGYDAVLLFLDELILWLSQNSADLSFVKREAAKLTSLVEAQSTDRPIPLISFVARQRDLRQLIGENVPGAEKLIFSDSLDFQQGRFETITLEDRNLPAIAEKRVLKCKTESARQELDAAFEQTRDIREAAMNTLLTSDGDREMFRKVYPFSPALMQTLIAVSSVLQRERTALKVMMQLLVDQRDTLEVGDIVPVGDLFDVIAHGDEAFSSDMAVHFDNAKRLYHQKLLPLLEKKGRREDLEKLPLDDPRRVEFRNNDRLVKTLLLAALVPEVESLRSLTAERLAALNHGTIKTPIPGREGQEVLRLCKGWAASVGGVIQIGDEANPTISVQLSGVDTETIIKQAEGEDNQGNRIRRVRQMLFEQLGIDGEGEFEQFHDFLWKNTKRSCTVLFKNIRELPDSSLENNDEPWTLIIDFPFDEASHGPRDDLSRIQSFASTHADGAKTLCWVPAFFSADAQKDLGTLVILEHILTGERFSQYSTHLSPQDRPAAKSLLENQRGVLRQRVQNHLDAAYGLDSVMPGSLDTTHELELNERFCSLLPGFEPQPPVAANLGGAMHHLLGQALAHEFPAAPDFETELKKNHLKKVYEHVSESTQAQDGRVPVERPLRPLMRHIANPLLLGEMGHDATHFVLGHHWKNHFTRKAAETGSEITVGQLRKWIDEPKPMGLPTDAQNLVILAFAEQTNLSCLLHGAPFEPSLANLPDQCLLKPVDLPSEEQWTVAVDRAGSIFGVAVSPLLKASNVANLSTDVQKKATESRNPCQGYCQRLRDHLGKLGLDAAGADRMKTATATQTLVERVHAGDSDDVVATLVSAEIATTDSAMGECLTKAAELNGTIEGTNWEVFDAVGKLTDERKSAADAIRSSVVEAMQSDEHVVQLGPVLKTAQSKALRLLTETRPVTERVDDKVDGPDEKEKEQTVKAGKRLVSQGSKDNLDIVATKDLVAGLEKELGPNQDIRVNVSWIIEEGETEQ